MSSHHSIFVGLDVGTQGARAAACDGEGHLHASASVAFPPLAPEPGERHEMDPEVWWRASVKCLGQLVQALKDEDIPPTQIVALSVTSTSGTILFLDRDGRPIRPAILYNDQRAKDQARRINEVAADFITEVGYRFKPSFGLPKILWVLEHEPETIRRTHTIAHAADYIVGRLTGQFGITDTSNVLKTGYDSARQEYPAFFGQLGLPRALLPRVVKSGTIIGVPSRSCGQEIGLSAGTRVVAGATDGTAAFIASGASSPGDWNSTLGTTLVVRGVSENRIADAQGRIYCHRHPDGYWLPGGASNVGGECLEVKFPQADFAQWDAQVDDYTPNQLIVYPLVRTGERFPFVDPAAEGFVNGEPVNETELYAAYLEGVAFVERWCYDVLAELGAPFRHAPGGERPRTAAERRALSPCVFATGGGNRSEAWLNIRAAVLNQPLRLAAHADSASGAAILAATGTFFRTVTDAVRAMVHIEKQIDPPRKKLRYFQDKYERFRQVCARRGLGAPGA